MRKNYLFLGFGIPDEEMKQVFESDRFPAVQTHKFNWNLIKGLENYDFADFTYISARPVSDYPFYPRKKISGNVWRSQILDSEIRIREIPYLNTSLLKIITRTLSGLYYSVKEYHQKPNKGGIIVYSVHVPFMLIGFLLSRFYKIDFIGIWTDPPSVISQREGFLKSHLRNLVLRISKALMSRVTKVIALTKFLAEDFAPGKPYLVVEGIIDEQDANRLSSSEKQRKDRDIVRVVYTGSIAKRYRIQNIVEAFTLLENKNIILEVYGCGDYEDELRQICLKNKNIRYYGFVPNEKALRAQREADFLINARSADDYYVKYSFPSKTLEYMLSGTPLITTILPGMPEDYRDFVIVLEDSSPRTISETLQKASELSVHERRKIGINALEFAKTKDFRTQGEQIANFILNEFRH